MRPQESGLRSQTATMQCHVPLTAQGTVEGAGSSSTTGLGNCGFALPGSPSTSVGHVCPDLCLTFFGSSRSPCSWAVLRRPRGL